MAIARKSLIDLYETPYYHIILRCVRRVFLCSEDKYSGNNYNHRRQWVLDKIHLYRKWMIDDDVRLNRVSEFAAIWRERLYDVTRKHY